MNQKKNLIMVILLFVGGSLLFSSLVQQESAKELFERAIYLEETKGDLEKAIEVYKRLVKEFPDERMIAVKAQLHIGLCYEKLGLEEAQKAFQKVIDNYPEQTEEVKVAREKLARLQSARAVVEKGVRDFTIRQVKLKPESGGYEKVSLNGRYRSFVDWETGDLAIHEIATGKTRRLTNKGSWQESDEYPVSSIISPDSKLVAYGWYKWYKQQEFIDLRLIGIDGSHPRILYSNENYEVNPKSWSYSNKQIAAIRHCKRDGTNEIVLVSSVDGSIRVLKKVGRERAIRMSHSADDRYIAFDFPVEDASGNYDISILATDGSGEIPLIEHPANDRLLGWIPGRNDILFLSQRSGSWDAWIIHVEDAKPEGPPQRVKADIGEIWPLGFTQDGSFYFSIFTRRFYTHIIPFDLKTGKVEGELSKPILGSNFSPEWSPDGEYLAFILEETETAGPGFYRRPLHIRNIKTGEDRELASDFEVRSPRWSPDGRYILVIGFDNNKRNQKDYNGGVYQVDVKDGHVTELVKFPPIQDWEGTSWWPGLIAEWSIDGKDVFFINRGRIFRRELDSNREKQLYSNPNLAKLLDLSPNGEELVFGIENNDEGTCSILIMSISSGEARELCKLQDLLRIDDVTWTPDGKYVFFTENKKNGSTLWRISPEGGELQELWQSNKRNAGLSIHPDEQKIAYSTFEQTIEHWVMENFLPKETERKIVLE